jgi:hypothetical protein
MKSAIPIPRLQRLALCYLELQLMPYIATLFIVIAVVALALALAYVPMRLLVGQIARNVRELIQRQRDRRNAARDTPDRRREA